jgi:hypothetical protein
MHAHARKSSKSFAHGNIPIEDASHLLCTLSSGD